MAMLIIGGERTVLHGSDPDMLPLSVLHEARRRGMRAALAAACGGEDAA